jgi:hypothetical protein
MNAKMLQLAQRLCDLDCEAEDVRNQMRKLLANGAGGEPSPRPTSNQKGCKRAAMLEEASEAEGQIIAALKDGPQRHAGVLKATGQRATSTSVRLARLQAKGLVQHGDDSSWSLPTQT